MRIQFDANQAYQTDAVDSVVRLFEGQPLVQGETEITLADQSGLQFTELGIANRLVLAELDRMANLATVQGEHVLGTYPAAQNENVYTVEMETGTGKTYVYLRTIFELNARYGWKKFIIVVPSVAIREGVLKNIELTREHFQNMFGNLPFDTWIYDSAQASRLRSFATSNTLQILILNIQAFDKKDINVIHQDLDRMSGHRPLDFIQQSRPIVILDEPQNMTSENRKNAIRSLDPLFELRYSATHREVVNLVYRLDPVQAYDKRLVKRIEVSSILEEPDFNRPYICIKSISAKPITAKVELDVETSSGPTRKTVAIKSAEVDLFELSGEREQYRDYIVDEIDAGKGVIRFSNGLSLAVGESSGADKDDVMRAQIRETIKQHFEKENSFSKLVKGERMKVLSLFFIDRVANYAPHDGKIRQWFEEEYNKLQPQYESLKPLPVEQVHNGYFSQDKSGPKDTRGDTKADDAAYELIMKDKERLLSLDEPLRFIFSHTALREGWDNPNVFQICTLSESGSEIKKRQEIGRGLRLPVREDGTRCFDEDRNRLTVIANESYVDFARALQGELKDDCGVEFDDRIRNARERKMVRLKKGWSLDPEFQALWSRIRAKTRYNVRFETDELIKKAAKELRDSPTIRKPRISVQRGEITITRQGVVAEAQSTARAGGEAANAVPLPDMISYLQRETELTRSTLAEVLIQSGRLKDVHQNPQQFLSQALQSIRSILTEFLVDGIEYVKIDNVEFEQRIFEDSEIEAYLSRLVAVKHSICEELEVDSNIERRFATGLDIDENIKLFIKLPRSFKVETPLGTYNPDWAIVREEDSKVYLIRETKGTTDRAQLRVIENAKIQCGKRHFEELGVDFQAARLSSEV